MKILVVGTVRNVGRTIQKDFTLVFQALESFGTIETFLVESDSTDNTTQKLEELAQKYKSFEFKSLGNLSSSLSNRIERIRYCRNQYVDYIRIHHFQKNWDYVIVADLDGMNRKLSSLSIGTSFSSGLNWSACFANQRNGYYDLYALRCKDWVSEDVFSIYQFLKVSNPFVASSRNRYLRWLQEFRHFDRLRKNAIYNKMRKISPGQNWIAVDSAFGGFGIYRPEVFLRFNYNSQNLSPTVYCEHIDLHYQCRAANLSLYINPALINSNWNEYNLNRLKLVRFLKEFKKFLLRKISE